MTSGAMCRDDVTGSVDVATQGGEQLVIKNLLFTSPRAHWPTGFRAARAAWTETAGAPFMPLRHAGRVLSFPYLCQWAMLNTSTELLQTLCGQSRH